MPRKGTKKGRTLQVPSEWLEEVNAYKKASGKTLQQLGADLGRHLKRSTPIPTSTVHDYLVGRVVTEELTVAFAALMGVPPPVLVTDADPELREWLELGRALRAETPDRFQRELVALRDLVEALRRHRLR